MKTLKTTTIKVGDVVEVSPELTSLKKWVSGIVIKIFKNPFIGDEIAMKDDEGRIFYGEKIYFKTIKPLQKK